jgi:hypothetical protein
MQLLWSISNIPRTCKSRLFLVSATKNVLKERFPCPEQIITKAARALTEVTQNGFQECFQKLYEHCKKCVTAQGN